MRTYDATHRTNADQHKFARLWEFSGARPLVGYESLLVTALAQSDLPTYKQLLAVDLDDANAVFAAGETIRNWRRDVANGTRTFSFGPRTTKSAPPTLPCCRARVGRVDHDRLR
jgi:hypothetical protein